jgi:hypothetical protein
VYTTNTIQLKPILIHDTYLCGMPSSFTTHFVVYDGQRLADLTLWESDMKKAVSEVNCICIRPKVLEARDMPSAVDLQVHFNVPVYGFFPWSYHNWLFLSDLLELKSYHDYMDHVNFIFFKTEEIAEQCRSQWIAEGRADWIQRSVVWKGWESLVEPLKGCLALRPKKGVRHLPPILEQKDCPSISIITPTFQRKKLMEIAFHNLLSTDYPQRLIEWIVVEDNDKSPHVMEKLLAEFQIKAPRLKIKYIPLEGRRSIGEKRNIGIGETTHDIILFMDDDDHYPPTSFRRRVAWLTKGKVGQSSPQITCCTTIALYDLKKGTSAVNIPPLELPLSQRISEATLTFYKSVWKDRAFPEVSLAEGESWIKGRESIVLEMPPQQIIVAFTHGQNQSGRRLPPQDQPPSCFWGFPREYLVFIHDLVGVTVE